MRITSGMYNEGIYGVNNSKLSKELFNVNRQIASGQQFQYGHQNVIGFSDTMRLDNEVNILGQIKKSTESGYKISKQTDTILSDFQTSIERAKVLIVKASSASNSDVSLDAIAVELRGIEKHLKNIANSSINGQYLFSGSAIDIKPIGPDGVYKGNDGIMESILDSNVKQQYNISGSQLFLGENLADNRIITSNVVNKSQTAQYPKFDNDTTFGTEKYLTADDTIRDLMGDIDEDIDDVNEKHFFYLSGTKSDGVAFRETISMKDTSSVDELLTKIGDAYGNTPDAKVVNVSLNIYGQIVVEDKMKGSSKLDFHMVGATDFNYPNIPAVDNRADILDSGAYAGLEGRIENLDNAETDFRDIMTAVANGNPTGLFVKEFVKSDYKPADGAATTIDGLLYDRTMFTKKDSKLSSNIPQVVQGTNAFATDKTKLSDVVAKPTPPATSTLEGTQFKLVGTNINGLPFDVQVDFAAGGSTFSLDGGVTNFDIFNMKTPRGAVAPDDMTYRQFMDVINMAMTGTTPATNTAADYDAAAENSKTFGGVNLSYDGKIGFEDKTTTSTKATLSMYDANSENFSNPAPILSFNSNNALTVSDPKTDFFKSLDSVITAVEDYKLYPDGSRGTTRNIGMQNGIALLDDLQDHLSRTHAQVGAQSNSLTRAIERTTLLSVSTQSLRSSVLDTDIAESTLHLTQLKLNMEAMYSAIGKVSKLNLVNYL